VKGVSSATWIMERIAAYASSVGEPFTAEETYMLKQSIGFFNETNRAEFLALNKKTVRMIRESIVREKLDGADCEEVRAGLFIPPQWRRNYLDVYDSNLPWLLSHCTQSAMLHDPTLGETEDWESPRIVSGFRDSELTNAKKSDPFLNSDTEFGLLLAAIKTYFGVIDSIVICQKLLMKIVGGEEPVEETIRLLARSEVVNVINSFSELDDDITSAWSIFVLDEKIHESGTDARSLLRSKTKFGTNIVFSKAELNAKGLYETDFCTRPSSFYLDFVANFDFMCKQFGVEAIATKRYASSLLNLALTVINSSVFSRGGASSLKSSNVSESQSIALGGFASMLLGLVDVIEISEDDLNEVDNFRHDLLKSRSRKSSSTDLRTVLEYGKEVNSSDFQEQWREFFFSTVRALAVNRVLKQKIEEIEIDEIDPQLELARVSESEVNSIASRLSQLEDLLSKGLISQSEYESKRKQIIEQI
jgi:hypothetical protein